ncbi:MAG TPA: 30S ribosomal protein S20 [Candidatus Paceibacterota bacterium]
MARTKSAKKAERVSLRRRVFNIRRKREVKEAVHKLEKLVSGKDSGAAAALPALYKAVDKAAKNGTIPKNTAARMKSRLTKRVAALGS